MVLRLHKRRLPNYLTTGYKNGRAVAEKETGTTITGPLPGIRGTQVTRVEKWKKGAGGGQACGYKGTEDLGWGGLEEVPYWGFISEGDV